MDIFCAAFEDALRLLRKQMIRVHYWVTWSTAPKAERAMSCPKVIMSSVIVRWPPSGLFSAPIGATDARTLDPSLSQYSADECDQLLSRMSPLLDPFVLHRTAVSGETGSQIDLSVIVPFTSRSGNGCFSFR